MSYIQLNNITKHYGRGDAAVKAVRGMSFAIDNGEFVGVMGESGSGKSTLLSMMGALNTPSSGTYQVEGIDVYGLSQDRRADFRREYIGFVFQSFHLITYLTVIGKRHAPLDHTEGEDPGETRNGGPGPGTGGPGGKIPPAAQ